MELGDRIKAAAAKVGGQRSLSKLINVSERTLSDYVSEKSSPQLSTLEKIALVTDTDLVTLVRGTEQPSKASGNPPGDAIATARNQIALPRYEIQASAGFGALADGQEVADFITVSRDWLMRYVSGGANVVVIEARGDSMEPTVRHGDMLLVEMGIHADTVAAGGVFVVTISGMIMIKRLQIMLNGDLKIASDNKHYEPETIPAEERDERVIIHGRVFWSGGPLGAR